MGEPEVSEPTDGSDTSAHRKRRLAESVHARTERVKKTAEDARTRYTGVDVAFRLYLRDAAVGGAVLAGAVAFRLFLWTLPAVLLLVGLIGFNASDASDDAKELGLGKATANSVAEAAQQSHHGRWVLVLIGLVGLVTVSKSLGRTLAAAVAITWRLPLRSVPRGYARVAGATAGVALSSLAVVAFCSWLRHVSLGIGIVGSLLAIVVWTAGWWGVSFLLPHPPLPWWGLLPGAALFGVGAELLHLAIIFYLSPKVSTASAVYGSLGLASTLLLGAYLLTRLMIASAGFDATIYERYIVAPEAGGEPAVREPDFGAPPAAPG